MFKVLLLACVALACAGSWNYPVVKKGGKIGIHALGSGKVPAYAAELHKNGTHFPVVKSVSDISFVITIKQMYPKTITLCRLITANDACPPCHNNDTTQLQKAANATFEQWEKKVKLTKGAKEYCDYWELQNEPLGGGTPVWQNVRLAKYMDLLMDGANKRGIKLALFTWSAGTPEWNDMQAIVATGIFGRMKANGHIMAVHEGVFGNDPINKWWNQTIPGSPHVPGAGPLCFRYRFWNHILEQHNELVPIISTEFYYGGGFQNTRDVIKRAQWYDNQAKLDYNFWSVCPFTVSPTPGWKAHDYDHIYTAPGGFLDFLKEYENRTDATP
eukprot:TRINITY_DN68253_c0_g1_i1.p1 TRINITY_DN68253_c0_g1~~TRINITY_DN68253_c0_g1_i1.p1  ORF type:complete len:329 (+),score=35.71 TRINITY_DN68253_c0_g1_i1:11-997(+)